MGKKDEGILLVVSGPSGAGKGTICNEIRNIYPELNYSERQEWGKKRGSATFSDQRKSLKD